MTINSILLRAAETTGQVRALIASFKTALQVLAMIAVGGYAAEAFCADASWMLSYSGRSTNALFWDQRMKGVVQEALPTSLSSKVLAALGGPPDPVFVVGSTLSASACVAHSCPDKGFFWIDTANGAALGASASQWGCDEGAESDLPCDLLLGSRRIAQFQEVPASGKQALMAWMNENRIRVRSVRFVDGKSKGADLDPAAFRLTERFQPPSTGPSFDCRQAQSPIETTICANPALAKLDLDMANLYGKMRSSYDTVGSREQLRDLQRAWLNRRNTTCPDQPDQVPCLEAEYRRHHDDLRHWVPAREKPNK